jgi:transposase
VARAQLIITAVVAEGRSKSEVARDYGVSRYWVQQLVQRYQREGPSAFLPRSRRPHHSPHAVDADTEEMIIRLRKELSKQGLDAGAETIAAHLARRTPIGGGQLAVPAVSTNWRILSRRGFVNPQPQKRPRSSWRTFCADQPNERWQADITHWQLADGIEVGILNIIDDHSPLCLGSDARRHTTGPDVVTSFRKVATSGARLAPSTTRGPPRDFASLLPLILNMHDLFARAKPGQFARPLNPRKGQATYRVGDLAYCDLAIFIRR